MVLLGDIAQLGERTVRIRKVEGSSPFVSILFLIVEGVAMALVKKLLLLVIIVLVFGSIAGACSKSNNKLIGKWEYLSGEYIFFFGEAQYIEFFSDNTVYEYEYRTGGVWSVIDGTRLRVREDNGDTYIFTFTIAGNKLTITDEDSDSIVYVRQ